MKKLSRKFLDEYGWVHINIGSSVVSFCEQCGCQRTHTVVEREWDDGDWVFSIECDHCCIKDDSKTIGGC